MIKIGMSLLAGLGAAVALSSWGHQSPGVSLACGCGVALVGIFGSGK